MSFSAEEIELSQADVRAFAMIQLALPFGALMFLGVCALFYAQGMGRELTPEQVAGAVKQAELFTMVNLFMASTTGAMALLFVPKVLLTQHLKNEERPKTAADAAGLLGVLRNTDLISLALLEGSSLFGVVIIFLAVNGGAAAEAPWVWANAGYTVLMCMYVGSTIYTEPRVQRRLKQVADGPYWDDAA